MICAACGVEPASSPPQEGACPECGQAPTLDGRYALEAVLGRGAAGTTFLGRRIEDGQPVAIKESLFRRRDAEKARQLIEREARVLRQLRHEQIPTYVDHLVTGSGKSRSLFLVQEHVQGMDLARRLDEHRYDEEEVLLTLRDLCPVLSYLHGLSPPVIHRDVKPANVIRTPDGGLVLVDFGSVRDAMKDAHLGGSTVAGTFGYMAPEQFAGDAEPVSDLYGLGALAVALLTRKDPAVLQGPDRSVRWREHAAVSRATAALLDDLLATDPRDRPRSASAVQARVRAILSGDSDVPVPARSASPPAEARAPALTVADRPAVDEPEAFGQPPALPPSAGLTANAAATGVGILSFVVTTAVLLLTLGVAGWLWWSAPVAAPVLPPPTIPIVYSLADGNAGPWPTLSPGEIDSMPFTVTCRVETRVSPVGSGDPHLQPGCYSPFAAAALRWNETDGPTLERGADARYVNTVEWSRDRMPPRAMIEEVTTAHDLEPSSALLVDPTLQPLVLDSLPFPEAARGARLSRVNCIATLTAMVESVPTRLDISGCPESFHAATWEAVRGSRQDVVRHQPFHRPSGDE